MEIRAKGIVKATFGWGIMRGGWIALSLVMLAPIASATTSPVDFETALGGFEANGKFTGQIQVSSVYLQVPNPASNLELTTGQARLVTVRSPNADLLVEDALNFSSIAAIFPARPQNSTAEEFLGTLRVQSRDMTTAVLIPNDGGLQMDYSGRIEGHYVGPRQVAFRPLFEGRMLVPAEDPLVNTGPVEIHGGACLLIHEANMELSGSINKVIQTGRQPVTSQIHGPVRIQAYEDVYVVACSNSWTGILSGNGWATSIASVDGFLDGRLTLFDLKSWSGAPQLPEPISLLQLDGELRIRSDQLNWSIAGNATQILLNGKTRIANDQPIAKAIAISALLLSAIYLIFRNLPTLAIWLGFRVQPLGNPTRVRLLDLVQKQPGLSAAQAGRDLGIKRASVMFHARILAKANQIRLQRYHNQWHFLTASANYSWIANAAGRNLIRRHILSQLANCSEPLTASELRLAGTTYPLLNYHLQKLVAAGLIRPLTKNGGIAYLLHASNLQSLSPSVANAVGVT